MRLFRRRDENAAATATPDPEGPAIGASADGGDDGVVRPPKQPTGDWMTMAPMAPSFAPTMPTTFRVQTLPEILTSHRDTRLSSSLGHAVSADAPSGTVSGLASNAGGDMSHAGDVSHGAGMGSLELREPAHHTTPSAPAAATPPPLHVRRLADPAPLTSLAAAAPSVARLPEPTVSRSLLDTAPLAARPSTERPLPVARVVDAPAAAAAPSPTSSPDVSGAASLSSEPEPPASAPLTGDDPRVGGFGVDDGTSGGFPELAAAAHDVPRTTAPPELAPPIQPRRIQRRIDGAATPPARPSSPAPSAPLLGDTAPPTSLDGPPAAAPASTASPSSPAGDLPLVQPPAAGAAEVVVSRLPEGGTDAAPAGSSDAPRSADVEAVAPLTGGSATSPTTDVALPATGPTSATDTGGGGGGDLPLHAPAVQPPIQRLADTTAPARASDVAPLAGRLPTSAAPAASSTGDTTAVAGGGDLPLRSPATTAPVQRAVETGGGATAATSPGAVPLAAAANADEAAPTPAASADEPRADIETTTTTTLGADAAPIATVQPMAESAGPPSPAASTGTGSLPLAPVDLGGTIQPPVPRSTVPDVQRQPEASATSRPLAAPLPTTSGASGPSVQRLAAAAPSSRGGAPGTSSGTATLPLVRPLAGASPAASAAMSASASTAPADLPVQLRRLGAPEVGAGVATVASLSAAPSDGGSRAGSLPLAPVQRLDGGGSAPSAAAATASPAGPTTADLPLHTPAASIPTAADIAVRAGLAERGPDGSLFTSAAPAATSFSVQREAESDVSVQTERSVTIGSHRARPASTAAPATASLSAGPAARPSDDDDDNSGGGGGGNDAGSDAKNLAAEAKKLYPYIRSALENDIRRQLEGKSRANRFRP